MSDYIHSGANKMNKVEAYKNDNKLLLADKLGHAKVSSLKEQNLLNTIATVQQHSNKITQLETDANKVRGAYVYKGTVETEFDLPLNNNSVGDVYNISSTGMNYAWTGENWDKLGGTSNGGASYSIDVTDDVFGGNSGAIGLKLATNNSEDNSYVIVDAPGLLNINNSFVPTLKIESTFVGTGPGEPSYPAISIDLSYELSEILHDMAADIVALKAKIN